MGGKGGGGSNGLNRGGGGGFGKTPISLAILAVIALWGYASFYTV